MPVLHPNIHTPGGTRECLKDIKVAYLSHVCAINIPEHTHQLWTKLRVYRKQNIIRGAQTKSGGGKAKASTMWSVVMEGNICKKAIMSPDAQGIESEPKYISSRVKFRVSTFTFEENCTMYLVSGFCRRDKNK